MTFIAHAFPFCRLQKAWLDKCLKRLVSENPLRVNMLRRTKHCEKLHKSTFIIFFNHSERLTCKISLLVICQFLGLSVKTLTFEDKYSLLYKENLLQPFQIQLSNEKENFLIFFAAFLKLMPNFEHFARKRPS